MGRWAQASRRGSSVAAAAVPPPAVIYVVFQYSLSPNTITFRVPGGLHTKYWKARARTAGADPWVTCPFSFQDANVTCEPIPGMFAGGTVFHQAAEFAAGDIFVGPWTPTSTFNIPT